MALKGITFAYQVPTAKAFRSFFAGTLTDGFIDTTTINISRSAPEVEFSENNYVMADGGIVELNDVSKFTFTPNNKAYGRLKLVIDTTKASTKTQFKQASLVADYSNTLAGFSELRQDDINSPGATGTYEAELLLVQFNYMPVPDSDPMVFPTLIRVAKVAPKLLYGDTLPGDAVDGTIFLVKST